MPSFNDIPQMTVANYRVNVSWKYLQEHMEHINDSMVKMGSVADWDPDFQRAHVWNEVQQRRYIEWILRGGVSGRDIYCNCVGWMGSFKGPFVLVDGKQRLNAVLRFLHNEIPIFDGNYLSDYSGGSLLQISADFVFHVNNLKTRSEVLQWYIDLNEGGVSHTSKEIAKVKYLLAHECKE